VGLFPVRAGKPIIGLLQFNDRRPGRFTAEQVAFYEVLAQNIGLAIQRKTAEEELVAAKASAEQAKAAAEQANRAKDHFLAVLSHELRTPLTPVVMGVSMLQDRSDVAPAVRETLEMIGRHVEMEARLIDDLLDVSRIAQGKLEFHKQRVELCTVIQRAVEVCQPDIEARGLHFGVDVGPAAPYWVEADVARLQQVFWNLLKNAIKFTPHGGYVGVRCRRNENYVVAEVNDSGIGMEPESLSRVFNAFEQAERSITRQFGGLGLGLAISKALVEMHGGTIDAHSEGQGRGATFFVQLPLAVPDGQPSPLATATPPERTVRPLRVLLVEDHGVTARMMQMVLTEAGHTIEMASDVATAMELAAQHQFDLLLSDLGLPDGNGHDLIRQLRQRGHRFPAIALSGYGQEDDIHRSYAAGFAAHVTKPASREAVLDAIASVTATEIRTSNG
jgi:two-component system CheB/CheR fusion protein